MARLPAALALVPLVACGGGSEEPPASEVVVADASLGGAPPSVIGATGSTVFWTASSQIPAASVGTVPAMGVPLATATGLVAHGGDHVVFIDGGSIARVDASANPRPVTAASPEALAASPALLPDLPRIAWTNGAVVSWGVETAEMTATLNKVDRCDHLVATREQIYVAADGASGRRLLRVDPRNGEVSPVTASSTWAAMFPGGARGGATYAGRIVAADETQVLWLVEEIPTGRGLLIAKSLTGDPVVLLEHVTGASGFFASDTALYWQEGTELLTAARGGGEASIVATLPGPAGALADGYVYFADGNSIERLRVE